MMDKEQSIEDYEWRTKAADQFRGLARIVLVAALIDKCGDLQNTIKFLTDNLSNDELKEMVGIEEK